MRFKILRLCEQKTTSIVVVKMMMQMIVVGVWDWATIAFPDKTSGHDLAIQ
jgi:hypothetical protein